MNISRMNVKITFQKSTITEDEIGNQLLAYEDYFTCFASTSTKTGSEVFSSEQTVVTERLSFTVRYSSETANITSDGFRIKLGNRIYNIVAIDDMAFKHRCIKFHTELERRQDE